MTFDRCPSVVYIGGTMPRKPRTVSEALRKAIRESGLNAMELARATGVDNAALYRFLSDERGLTLASVDRLAEYLGLELTQKRRAKRR
jgi:plasmid maintenance system antidote protein VapI